MRYIVKAKQINFGHFEIEADTQEEATKILEELIEDDFTRETSAWEIGEISINGES